MSNFIQLSERSTGEKEGGRVYIAVEAIVCVIGEHGNAQSVVYLSSGGQVEVSESFQTLKNRIAKAKSSHTQVVVQRPDSVAADNGVQDQGEDHETVIEEPVDSDVSDDADDDDVEVEPSDVDSEADDQVQDQEEQPDSSVGVTAAVKSKKKKRKKGKKSS